MPKHGFVVFLNSACGNLLNQHCMRKMNTMTLSTMICLTCMITLIALILFGKTHIEQYTDQEIYKNVEYSLCKYIGDTGLVCPMVYQSEDVKIIPYQECSQEVKQSVCQHVYKEWKAEAKLSIPEETHDYISSNWSSGDIFYVLLLRNTFLGCVAVDRKQFYPFMSHLYIHPLYRGNGYGKFLLTFCEQYVKQLQFDEIRLWCNSDLIGYYKKLGYDVIENKSGKSIMVKKL